MLLKIIVIIVFSSSMMITITLSHGLTTFGKTQNLNQNSLPPSQLPAIARDCFKESDCNGVQETTCVLNPKNMRKQCLCGDNKAPINGICNAKYKGLRHSCNNDEDCLIGTECILSNSTQRFAGYPTKTCQCSKGYIESNFICNSVTNLNFRFCSYLQFICSLFVFILSFNYL